MCFSLLWLRELLGDSAVTGAGLPHQRTGQRRKNGRGEWAGRGLTAQRGSLKTHLFSRQSYVLRIRSG